MSTGFTDEGMSPVVPDRSDSVLGHFDFTDLLQEFAHYLRCDRIEVEGNTQTWKTAYASAYKEYHRFIECDGGDRSKTEAQAQEHVKTLLARERVSGDAITVKPDYIQLDDNAPRLLGFTVTAVKQVREYTPPLMNDMGISALTAFIHGHVNRVVALSNINTGNEPMLLNQMLRVIGRELATLLFVKYKEYGIRRPTDLPVIYWPARSLVAFGIRMPLDEGIRRYLEVVLKTTHTIVNTGEQMGMGLPGMVK